MVSSQEPARRTGLAVAGSISPLQPAARLRRLPSKRVDIVENRELTQDNTPDHMGRLQVLGVDRRSTSATRRGAIGKVGVVEPDPHHERHRFVAMCPGSQPAMQNTPIALARRMMSTIQAKMS
jgi:hypothetical protein